MGNKNIILAIVLLIVLGTVGVYGQTAAAQAAFNRGAEAVGRDDYNRAIIEFTEAIKLYQNYAGAYYQRGWSYYILENYENAIADFSQAIRLEPNNAWNYLNRGLAYLYKPAQGTARRQNLERAISDFEAGARVDSEIADRFNPQIVEARQELARLPAPAQNNQQLAQAAFDRGEAAINQRNWNRAITEFNEAIRLNPNNSEAFFRRSQAYFEMGDGDRAFSDLQATLRLNPNHRQARILLDMYLRGQL